MVSAPGRDGRVVDAVASRYDVLGGTRAPLAALVVALVVSLAWRVRRSRRRAICRGIAVTRLSKATSSACPGDATDTANAPPWLDEIVDGGRPLGVTSSCSAAHAPPLPHLPIQIHGLVSRGTRTSSAVSLSSPSPPGCSPTRISVRPAAPAPATARRGTSDGRWHPTRLAARLPLEVQVRQCGWSECARKLSMGSACGFPTLRDGDARSPVGSCSPGPAPPCPAPGSRPGPTAGAVAQAGEAVRRAGRGAPGVPLRRPGQDGGRRARPLEFPPGRCSAL